MANEVVLMIFLVFGSEVPWCPANPVECRENEYLDDRGKCTPCKQCGPGLELSEECGYGEGSNAQCTPCQPRRFKDSWGHRGCKPCASCWLINRIQTSNCTPTLDATCGECLPGFYSKSQIGGSWDLECIPCTAQTPPSEPQCRARVSLVKVGSLSAPPHDGALVALASGALAVILLLLLSLSILYCRRLWKSQCRRGPAEAGRCIPEAEISCLHLPGYQPAADALGPKTAPARSLLETRPLLRCSECSDCSAGGSSFTELMRSSGGDSGPPTPPPLSFCAAEMQPHWPHAPVECTEMDLQAFSTQAEVVGARHKGGAGRRVAQEQMAPEGLGCSVQPAAQAQPASTSAQDASLSFRNPTAESAEQTAGDARSPVAEICDSVQDLPVASLPASLVLSLAVHLDPSLPGLKNFSHLGVELGVPFHQLHQISGFTELVTYLADSGSSVSVLSLAQALQKLQQFDAFLLLYDHFVGRRAQNVES